MKSVDDAIRNAVTKEDAEFLAKLEAEPGAMQQMVSIFEGPLSWVYRMFLAAAVVVGIAGVYSCWRFAHASELRPLLYWGAGMGFCLIVLAVIRIVFFLQINTNRVLRELKRLELQIALLATKNKH